MLLLPSADFFQHLIFSKNSFRYTIIVSNGLDSDQDLHVVGPDLGRNCLKMSQQMTKVAASQERVKRASAAIQQN